MVCHVSQRDKKRWRQKKEEKKKKGEKKKRVENKGREKKGEKKGREKRERKKKGEKEGEKRRGVKKRRKEEQVDSTEGHTILGTLKRNVQYSKRNIAAHDTSGVAWQIAPSIHQRKEKDKAAFFSPSEVW